MKQAYKPLDARTADLQSREIILYNKLEDAGHALRSGQWYDSLPQGSLDALYKYINGTPENELLTLGLPEYELREFNRRAAHLRRWNGQLSGVQRLLGVA
jgi:hypothetical protein